jgi:hypothetical protein
LNTSRRSTRPELVRSTTTLEIRDGGVRGQADVAPTMEWLAEGLIVSVLKAQLRGESLLADQIVYTLDQGTLSRYERRVLVH